MQFVARTFMVTEIGLAYVVLAEEMPAQLRGRANAFMIGSACVGGIVASLAFGPMVASPLGWRGLYLLGGVLLPLLPLYLRGLRETARFRALAGSRPPVSLLAELAATRVVLRPPYRRTTLVASALWFAANAWVGLTIFWFAYYAVNERGWEAASVGRAVLAASVFGLAGYPVAGALMDLVGRRVAAVLAFALGGAATLVCFTAQEAWLISAAFAAVLFMQPVSSIVGTLTSELFPTPVRATGNAVASHLVGRLGMVLSGFAVGQLSAGFAGSVGNAVALCTLVPLLAIPVVLLFVPETRGRALEEIGAT
jgi:putative MFS transporter